MFDTGSMSFFDIEKCGLYKIGSKKVQGLEIAETLESMAKWKEGRYLSETLPWDPALGKKNIANCYLRDIHKDEASGDYLVVLWKSSTKTGAILGAQEDDKVGEGESVKQSGDYKGRKVVWGHPCYYWVIPSRNVIVSIKFNHSMCDAALFREYFVSCINNRIPFENKVKRLTEKNTTKINFEGENQEHLSYRFNMKLKFVRTAISDLEPYVKDITHIVVRDTIQVKSRDERASWLKWINKLGKKVGKDIPMAKENPNQRRVQTLIESSPTIDEIKYIIEENQVNFSTDDNEEDTWDNIGFQMKNGSVRFVDKYRPTDRVVIPGQKDEELKAKFLMNEINKNRADYLLTLNGFIKEQDAAA